LKVEDPRPVSVVVVTFNSRSIVGEALAPLSKNPAVELVVVDNASADGTAEFIREEFPDATVVLMPSNVGFAKAVNEGVRRARHDIVMLLNPDAAITPSAVESLVSDLETENAGLVAPLLNNPGSPQRVVPAGLMPTIKRMGFHYSGLSRLGKRYPWSRGHYLFKDQLSSGLMDVDWVTGACMLFTRETWERTGGLSERWFMYAEDIDFCHRVQQLGARVILDTQTHADHLVGQSDSTSSFKYNAAWIINLRDFYSTELARCTWQPAAWTAVVSLGLFSRGAAFRLASLRSKSPARRDDARRFFHYAVALLRAPMKVSSS